MPWPGRDQGFFVKGQPTLLESQLRGNDGPIWLTKTERKNTWPRGPSLLSAAVVLVRTERPIWPTGILTKL
jgi:hypothetical protein